MSFDSSLSIAVSYLKGLSELQLVFLRIILQEIIRKNFTVN